MMTRKEYCEALGRCIRKAREEYGVRRMDLCLDADICPSSLSHYENGERMPTMRTLLKICGALRGDEEEVDEAEAMKLMKKNLRKAKAEKGYAVRELSKACGLATMCRYCTGRSFPEPYTLSVIAEVLGVRPHDLVPGTGELLGRMS